MCANPMVVCLNFAVTQTSPIVSDQNAPGEFCCLVFGLSRRPVTKSVTLFPNIHVLVPIRQPKLLMIRTSQNMRNWFRCHMRKLFTDMLAIMQV